MFKRWYSRAITRHQMLKAVFNPRGSKWWEAPGDGWDI
jgi:hypothetical protein